MKKNKVLIILVTSIVATATIIGTVLAIKGRDKNKQPDEGNKEEPIISYVEKNNIDISPSQQDYKIPVIPYAKDADKNIISPDGVTFEEAVATFKFYDYEVSEEDENGYANFSYKYDIEIPIKYTVDTSKSNPKWSRTLALPCAVQFDYYTGDVYREKNASVNGTKINYYNTDNIGATEDMNYTNITWEDKTYRIGVRTEAESKWDGSQEVQSADGIKTYTDVCRSTITVYIYAPKEYDGLMIALYKGGTSKEAVIAEMEEYNKYLGEHTEAIEDSENHTYKLLASKYNDDTKYTKDDFCVIRASDIKSIEK